MRAVGGAPTMRKSLLSYFFVVLIFGVGAVVAFQAGTYLYSDRPAAARAAGESAGAAEAVAAASEPLTIGAMGRAFLDNFRQPLGVLLLQLIVVLVAARLAGIVFHRLFGLRVFGEMIAGILLGPSLLGAVSPEAMNFLFPPQSIDTLRLLSQIGVILYMFLVGTELNVQHLRRNMHATVLVSHASIIIPFFLGVSFSLLMYRFVSMPNIPFYAFALFISVSMSITAFPVLARILEERGMSDSFVGSTAIACAAVDDITAWCILAVVVAIVKAGGFEGAVLTITLTMVFIAVMPVIVRPLVVRILGREMDGRAPGAGLAGLVLVFVLTSALFTEVIGIHALFGAFIAGVVIPKQHDLSQFLSQKLEVVTASFLLPLYFAFTGLRTQVGLLEGGADWLMCAGVVAVAIAGKLGGGALAARLTGMSWHNSLTLGVLMNTRGLVELIVLNIGYDLGILNPKVYSMMVIMALVTTFMTGPLLSLLESLKRRGVL